MALTDLINRSCIIIRKFTTDEIDPETGDAVNQEVLVDTVCEIQQIGTDEPPLAGELAQSDHRAFLLPGVRIATGDELLVPDLGEFEVIGHPDPMRNPRTQAAAQVEVLLRQTAGPDEGS